MKKILFILLVCFSFTLASCGPGTVKTRGRAVDNLLKYKNVVITGTNEQAKSYVSELIKDHSDLHIVDSLLTASDDNVMRMNIATDDRVIIELFDKNNRRIYFYYVNTYVESSDREFYPVIKYATLKVLDDVKVGYAQQTKIEKVNMEDIIN